MAVSTNRRITMTELEFEALSHYLLPTTMAAICADLCDAVGNPDKSGVCNEAFELLDSFTEMLSNSVGPTEGQTMVAWVINHR